MTLQIETKTDLEHHFVRTNGIDLHVVQKGPTDGPLLIFLHGFPEYWGAWHAQIAYFSEQGYRVWAPDQRGYNLSAKPTAVSDYALDVLADDVVGLIEASHQDKAYLVGHDWGGIVAWWVALRNPEKLHKLGVLNVPHPRVMEELFTESINPDQLLKSWYIGFFQLPLLPEYVLSNADGMLLSQSMIANSRPDTFSDEMMAQYRRAWGRPGAIGSMLGWYRALVRHFPTIPEDPRVHVPTIIVWGAQDAYIEQSTAPLSRDLCIDSMLYTIDEATHWIHHEFPDRVNFLLGDFFSIVTL